MSTQYVFLEDVGLWEISKEFGDSWIGLFKNTNIKIFYFYLFKNLLGDTVPKIKDDKSRSIEPNKIEFGEVEKILLFSYKEKSRDAFANLNVFHDRIDIRLYEVEKFSLFVLQNILFQMKDHKNEKFDPNELYKELENVHTNSCGTVSGDFKSQQGKLGILYRGADRNKEKNYIEYKISMFEMMRRGSKCQEVEPRKNLNALYRPIFSCFVWGLAYICEKKIECVYKEGILFQMTEKVAGKIMKPSLFFGLSLPGMEDGYSVTPLLFAEYGTVDRSDLREDEYEKHKDYRKMLFFLRVSIRVLLNLIKSRGRDSDFQKLKVFGILIGIQNGWILEVSSPKARLIDDKVDPGLFHLTIYNICLKKGKVDDLIDKLCFLRNEIEELIQFFLKIRNSEAISNTRTISTSLGTKQNFDGCYLEVKKEEQKDDKRYNNKKLFYCSLVKSGNLQKPLSEDLEILLKKFPTVFLKEFDIHKNPDGKLCYQKELLALALLEGCKGVVTQIDNVSTNGGDILYEPLMEIPEDFNKSSSTVVKSLLIGMVDSLLICHENSIYHCDVKRGNFMLDSSGNVKVVDFDISMRARKGGIDKEGYILKKSKRTRVTKFTKGYKPPEEHYHQKSDAYCLGIVFLEIVSGRRIHEFKNLEEFRDHCGRVNISKEFLKLVERMTTSVLNERLDLTTVKHHLSTIQSVKEERVNEFNEDNTGLPNRKRKREDEPSQEDLEFQKDEKKRRIDENPNP